MAQGISGFLQFADKDFTSGLEGKVDGQKLSAQLNRAFRLLYDRLDALEGNRGQTRHQNDVFVDIAEKGMIVKDGAVPAHYWRINVNQNGNLVTTDLGTRVSF